jgi:hypothetical protein
MRTFLVSVVFIAFFAVLCFAAILQDRMRRKTGASLTSLDFFWRSFATRELYLFALLVLLLAAAAAGLVVLDSLNYLPK